MDIAIVKFIQSIGNAFLDFCYSSITLLGETPFFFMVFLSLYLIYKKEYAFKYLFFFMLNGLINGAIKNSVKRDRPYTYDGVRDIKHSTGYSFPSGHTQNYALQATLIGIEFKGKIKTNKKRIYFFMALSIVGLFVAVSRIYLGQHFLTDVLAGAVFGILFAYGFETILKILPVKFKKLFSMQNVLFCLLPVVFLLMVLIEYFNLASVHMIDIFYSYLAIIVALFFSVAVDNNYLKYTEKSVWYIQLCKIVMLGLGLWVLSAGLQFITDSVVRHFYFYFIGTMYGTLLLPVLFQTVIQKKYKNK